MRFKHILLFGLMIVFGSSNLSGQSNGDAGRLWLETNMLSWVEGHSGPEIRLRYRINSTIEMIGSYKYADMTPLIRNTTLNDLTKFRQSLVSAHEFGLGLRFPSDKKFQVGFHIKYGEFKYNMLMTNCVEWERPSEISSYCRCLETEELNRRQQVQRFRIGLDLYYTLIDFERVSLGLRGSIGVFGSKISDDQAHIISGCVPFSTYGTLSSWSESIHNVLLLEGLPFRRGKRMFIKNSVGILPSLALDISVRLF
jgi:hypothetical protein